MSDVLTNVAQYGIPALFVLLGTWFVQRNVRRQTSVDASQRQIDQLQEDREADRRMYADARAEWEREREAFREQHKRMFERVEQLEETQRLLIRETEMRWNVASDYISSLRVAIDERRDPPPPPFPPELRVQR